ncbi:AraC family transcriptional regulator [Spirosoma sp. KCTC 42546]|uniref:helix-turn-helix domain-containing protein n=1 Tax=Spirosoma sp. KCTC 42546 TaxID=2520506 RepID=UPI00115B6A6B|nr:AraC family transcriptional regulator [Spirosoma sp. KCTC 42546]QDK83046.1 AraC family transcriptional regulator [Spirosoma sp. KCTC 42546]
MQDYQKRLSLNVLAYAVQKNTDPAQLCHLSGIELDTLKSESSPSLTVQQINALWLNATELSKDSFFGLHFGESLQVAALGVVGELIRHSQTIGEALTQAAAFSHLITDLLTMSVNRCGQSFTIQFIPSAENQASSPLVFRQMMDFFMAFTLHEVDGLILQKIRPISVRMPVELADLPEYIRVLRCQSIQNATDYALEFDSRFWDELILTADYELQAVLLRKVSALDEAHTTKTSLSERINNFLLANAYLGVPTLDAIAANLNVSSRSLQRKLQEEGVTYQQLTDSIRKSLALHYLQTGQHPVKEVSYILGYNELSAFNRAFRRWTGTTPVSYQKGQLL